MDIILLKQGRQLRGITQASVALRQAVTPITHCIFEQKNKERFVGLTGSWNWLVAFAPRSFEIWAIFSSPEQTALLAAR
jgi:hypothetical protein